MYLLFKNREDLHQTIQSDRFVPAHILLRDLLPLVRVKRKLASAWLVRRPLVPQDLSSASVHVFGDVGVDAFLVVWLYGSV